ncbi:MAG TPA: DUF3261 domain-containing protein [Gammaproteobacteria bacterium]|nr:DUF3261 domain-containing protein [Gammaproteobacteria bacterium]
MTRKGLINPSCRRRQASNALNLLDSGLRRHDEKRMSQGFSKYILVFGLVILAGCSMLSRPAHIVVPLTETHKIQLPPPKSLGRNIRLNQLATWEQGEQINRIQFIVEVDDNSIRMVGLTPWGTQMFSVDLGPGGLKYDRFTGMADDFRPEYMLTDFMLTYWSREQLVTVLRDGGLELVETYEPIHQRSILADGKTIIRIEYDDTSRWNGKVMFINLYRNYRFQIETLVYEPL